MEMRTLPPLGARYPQIDLLRAFAVMLVLGRHMDPCPAETNEFLHRLTTLWEQGGWIGVDVFFVLSGFLVSGLLFQEYQKTSGINASRFLIRRGFKIYPAFWFLILATIALRWRGSGLPDSGAILSELLFVQNYGKSIWNHTWSLAVEEHFYFLLTLLMFFLVRRPNGQGVRWIPLIVLATSILCLCLRLLTSVNVFYSHHTNLFPSHLRLDSLAFGVLLSYLFHYHYKPFVSFSTRFKWPLYAVGILGLLPPFFIPLGVDRFIYTFGLSLFYVAAGCLLIAALASQPSSNKILRGIAYVGRQSYSIYLWHMPVAFWVADDLLAKLHPGPRNWFLYSLVYLGGSIAVGVVMARLIEVPFLHIRDRFYPSKSAPKAPNSEGLENVAGA